MKSAELYKIYNKKKSRECIYIYIMIAISLLISVSVSIAIPQINHSVKDNIDKNAKLRNGSDIKICADVINDALLEKIDELDKSGLINELHTYNVMSSSIKRNGYNVFTTLMEGDYNLGDHEIIISSYTADTLKINTGDVINLSGEEYKVVSIDEQPSGVTEQAEQMGYCKVCNPKINSLSSSGAVFLLSTDKPAIVFKEINDVDGDFKCTTIEDQKKELNDQLNTNTLAMNMLNTMCIIMSLIAVFSSVFMIINQRKQDISVMKCLSIKTKLIRKALRSEIKRIVVLPVLAGVLLSPIISAFLLSKKHIEYSIDVPDIIIGAIFLGFMYFLFINLITLVISAIDPIAFLRDTKQSFSLDKFRIIILSFVYLILFLFVYAVFYIGNSNAFVGSIIIIFSLIAFYFISKAILRIVSVFRYMGKTAKYTFGRMKKSSSVTALLVVNLALMGWFIMFGFTFEKVSSASLHNDLEKKLDYCYILAAKDEQSDLVAEKIRNNNVKFTRLHRTTGYITLNDKVIRSEIGIIDGKDNAVSFNITEGKKVYELSNNEVIVSEEYANEHGIENGDNIIFCLLNMDDRSTEKITVNVAGLYQAGTINQYTMIATKVDGILGKDSDVFLVDADDLTFMDNIDENDAIVADVSMLENALEAMVGDYIFYFKNMCFICLIAVFIFIINMIFIEYYNNKEIVIIKALGISRKFLFRSAYLKQLIINVMGFVSALGLYYVVVNVLLKSMINTKPKLTPGVFIIPMVVFAGLCILCSLAERIFIKNNCTKYEMLREKD